MKFTVLVTIEELAKDYQQEVKWFYFLHVFGYLKLYSYQEELLCNPNDYESACVDWVIYWIKTHKDCESL